MVHAVETLTETLTTRSKVKTRQILIELSKEACAKCEVQNANVCFNCRIHQLINQLLRKTI